MDNKNLAADEARREAQLESMKASVETDLNGSIARRAKAPAVADSQRLEKVASELRGNAISGVVEKDRELERARGLARVAQVVNYLFGILYALLAVRLILSLAAARPSAGFVRFIDAVTNPFFAPFRGIVASPQLHPGGYTLVVPILIAMGAWALLHLGILGLMRLIARRQTAI